MSSGTPLNKQPGDTGVISDPYDDPDIFLTPDQIKEDLIRHFGADEQYKPLIALFEAAEDKDLDYSSPEVQRIIEDIEELGRKLDCLPPDSGPVHIPAHPFEEVLESKTEAEESIAEVGSEDSVGLAPSIQFYALKTSGFTYGDTSVPPDQAVELVEIDHDTKDFKNWGRTVQFTPSHTLVVRTVDGVCRVVKWAAKEGRRVRVAGFRHTWTQLYGKTGDVIIMFLPFDTLVNLPYKPPPESFASELTGISCIKIVDTVQGRKPEQGHAFCKIMAGVTNEQFRKWCFNNGKWSLPLNIIATEITFGGSNAPVCHGAGLKTSTLSDLVEEICYVDAKGDPQSVTDPDELRVASGCLGLLGVVVSITLRLDAMSVAMMRPFTCPLFLTIPPPKNYPIPQGLQEIYDKIPKAALEKARQDFIARCEKDYYLEWFWFPYQDECWVHTWQKRPKDNKDLAIKEYPGKISVWSQYKLSELANLIIKVVGRLKSTPFGSFLTPSRRAWIFGRLPMLLLPNVEKGKSIDAYVSDALHFRRGIQNVQCLSSEWEIPIPKVDGKLDYEVIQRAWWDGITIMQERQRDAPVRIALEMRLIGGSQVLLAPQGGHDSWISIEFVTTLNAGDDGSWGPCMQEVANKWTSYNTKDAAGKTLYTRPHWAKQWEGLTINKKPIEKYFKEDAYREEFPLFRKTFEDIVTRRGSTVEESLSRFGNDLMERLIFH